MMQAVQAMSDSQTADLAAGALPEWVLICDAVGHPKCWRAVNGDGRPAGDPPPRGTWTREMRDAC
jgi:hypothetical protein